jgi:hypothetical protein
MRSEGYGPAPHTAGSRYCRARRRHGAVPRAALTVRHTGDGLLLTRLRRPVPPAPVPRSWRAATAVGAAIVALVVSATLLLTGAYVAPPTAEGPCPHRTSVPAYTGGRELLVRAESARGTMTLLHLCADEAIGPVRAWELSFAAAGSRPVAVAVQRVAPSVALAAAPLTAGGRSVLTVTVTPASGRRFTFTTQVTGG